MTAQALSLAPSFTGSLRPFDIRRDLLAVADLVELCFADSLDADGRLYIRQMRQAAREPLFDLSAASPNLPMSGYVWEEEGRVVGNLSLIPHRRNGERLYLIANVAVHPDHRRRGIAGSLTQAALKEVERRGASQTWLQVDENNPAAVGLYRRMGFREGLRRTSWRTQAQRDLSIPSERRLTLRHRLPSDWARQRAWLFANYPEEVRWQLPLDLLLLQPGIQGAMQRLFSERRVLQWGAERKGTLLGVLSWQSTTLEADRLWLAADPENEEEAIPMLASHAHAVLAPGRPLALNYPAGRAEQTFMRSGFQAARTLIWMDYPWH